ncbi:hypothetical protein JCM16303_007194 [Sporobolomyces ruberrimus]
MPTGIINQSMRENYNSFGVENYYNLVQESYRNPHYPGLKKVLSQLMDTYVTKEEPKIIKVLDLAAGSGEATEALLAWKSSRWPSSTPSESPSTLQRIPTEPSASDPSPSNLNSPSPSTSRPPIQPRPFIPPTARPAFRPTRASPFALIPEPVLSITAADPFTSPAYRQRTGLPCLELSFNQVAAGELPPPPSSSTSPFKPETQEPKETEQKEAGGEGEGEQELYDIVIISFALHLVETSSELWALLTELAKRAKWLCVIAPHKKPDIKATWGWRRWDPSTRWIPAEGRGNVGGTEGDGFEIVLDRVRLRLWRSEANWVET